jgi:hypothetical protein
MKGRKGWVCVHRDIVDHWIYQEPEALKVWLTLLIEANHEKKTHMFNGAMIAIDRGQLVFGRIAFSEKTGVSENKIRRYISLFETEGMIHQQKTNKYSVITVANYAQYQDGHQQNTSKTPASHQQTTTPKQLNNLTIESIHNGFDFSSWPTLPLRQVTDDWFAMRKRIKADVSQTVVDRFGAAMTKAVADGYTVNDCLSECVLKSWQGFSHEWLKNDAAKSAAKRGAANAKPTVMENLTDRSWSEGMTQ